MKYKANIVKDKKVKISQEKTLETNGIINKRKTRRKYKINEIK